MNLIEHIYDNDVVLDQFVDHPLIEETAPLLLLMPVLQQRFMQVWPLRHHDRRHGAADHDLIRMDNFEIAFKLKRITAVPQRSPGFLQRNFAHAS